MVDPTGSVKALELTFYNHKHSYNQPPFSIEIPRQSRCCPVELLMDYLVHRGHNPGPLFVLHDGSPTPRLFFTDQLSVAISQCGLNPAKYKGHSFRIGAASHAADRGLSDVQIRTLGRWKSNAFHKYIRIQSMTS